MSESEMPGRISFDFRTNTMYPGEPTHDFQREHVTFYVRADLADAVAEALQRLYLATRGPAGEGPPGLDIEREIFDAETALSAYREGQKDG